MCQSLNDTNWGYCVRRMQGECVCFSLREGLKDTALEASRRGIWLGISRFPACFWLLSWQFEGVS